MSLIFFTMFTVGWLACIDGSKRQEVVGKKLHEARDDAQHKKAADSLHDTGDLKVKDSTGLKIGGNELNSNKN